MKSLAQQVRTQKLQFISESHAEWFYLEAFSSNLTTFRVIREALKYNPVKIVPTGELFSQLATGGFVAVAGDQRSSFNKRGGYLLCEFLFVYTVQ